MCTSQVSGCSRARAPLSCAATARRCRSPLPSNVQQTILRNSASKDVAKVAADVSPNASSSVGISRRDRPATSVTTCACTFDALPRLGTDGPSRASPLRSLMSASSWTCTRKIALTAELRAPLPCADAKCAATATRADLSAISVYISTQASLILEMVGLLTVQRSVPATALKAWANARALACGAARNTRNNHSCDTRPPIVFADLCR